MNITDVRINLTNKKDSSVKAVASITIDNEFVVHGIKVIKDDDKAFISMPARKDNKGNFIDVAHPIKTDTRVMLQDMILAKYNEIAK